MFNRNISLSEHVPCSPLTEDFKLRIEGKIVNLPGRGLIIGRFPRPVPLESSVMDNRRKRIGKVVSLLGPLDKPYTAIKIYGKPKNPLSLIGRDVFIEVE